MQKEQECDGNDTALSPKKEKTIFCNQSMPRWFRFFLYGWLAVILTFAAVGYGIYAVSGGWTPEHLLRAFLLGL